MSTPPLVSVIILNYNTFELTCKCISSVYAHTHQVSYEVIVVDNASTEIDPESFLERFPGIKLIVNATNRGFAGGNNIGIKAALGSFMVLLNSDAILLNDGISMLVSFLQANHQAGAVSGQLQSVDGTTQFSANTFPSISKELYSLLRLKYFLPYKISRKVLAKELVEQDKLSETEWVWGTFLCIPKNVIKGFPNQSLQEDFFMYFEDVQWCYYIRKALGKKVYYFPSAKVLHLGGGSSSGSDNGVKFLNTILPNQLKWLKGVKGNFYTRVYVLVMYLKFKTDRSSFSKQLAPSILKLGFA
jgi:GT2 family glycosyltransferase